MFLIYINDVVEEVNSYTNLFANDAKIMKKIKVEEGCRRLQEDIDKIYNWSKKSEMEFNFKKYSLTHGSWGRAIRDQDGTMKWGMTQ